MFRKIKVQDEKVILALNESNKNLTKETDKSRKLSTVDALTQPYTRFGIDQIVSTLITPVKDVAVDEPPFSLILLDIDHFKRVNDTRGHDAGDRVLKNVAKIINGSLREGDYIGRWGGKSLLLFCLLHAMNLPWHWRRKFAFR
nr:GGDEF domain-containing protein [Teredinibacter franksiae]